MHAMGIPDHYIMERGGWASERFMNRIYIDVIEDEKKKVTNKIVTHFEKINENAKRNSKCAKEKDNL